MRATRTLAWIAATGCCALAAPAAARAAIVDDNPAAAARGPGQVEVFIRGANGAPLRSVRTPTGAWTPWQALDGGLTSGPGAVASGSTTDLFGRGGDLATTYHRGENGSNFCGWEPLCGAAESAPAAMRERGSGTLVIYVRWSDNTIRENYVSSGAWVGWTPAIAGGTTLSAPAATSRFDGNIDLFARGTDDQVYLDEWSGTAWSGFVKLGDVPTQSAPAAVSRSLDTLDLFIRGNDGQIHWRTYNGAAWLPYTVIPGTVDSAPAATVDSAGNLYLFARLGGDVVVNILDGVHWSGWQLMHPPPPVPSAPRCSFGAGHMSVKTRTVSYGRRPRLTGRVVTPARTPLAGASLTVRTAAGAVDARGVVKPNGSYSIRLARGHDRRVQVVASVPALHALVCSSVIGIRVRAGVHLHASRTVRPGGTVHFSGRLLGGPLPRHGKVVELQAFDGGRWRTFSTPRARGKRERFHTTYHLKETFGPRTFRFRARVRREADYPYVLGYSRTVRVRVL
jgi:hypothetical protein